MASDGLSCMHAAPPCQEQITSPDNDVASGGMSCQEQIRCPDNDVASGGD
jgi:hypothetical protein